VFQKTLNNDSECRIQEYSFYNWLIENTNYLEKSEKDSFESIYSMFDTNNKNMKEIENMKITNTNILFTELKELLKKDGFIFAK
jgi:hypothetical protein